MLKITQPAPDNRDLIQPFLATRYRVSGPCGPIDVTIGGRYRALDELVAHSPGWCIITAWNPGGVRRSAAQNARAEARLRRRIEAFGPERMLPARNIDPAGRWPDEPGWLFSFADPGQVHRLAREFGQLGVVAGRPGEPAELWLYGPDWPRERDGIGAMPHVRIVES